MPDYKHYIDEIAAIAKDMFEKQYVSTDLVDNDHVYDVSLNLREPRLEIYSPNKIAFSYAKDAGYFMNIDNMTWEFDEDGETLKAEAIKYMTAIKKGKAKIVEKKLLGILTLKRELIIEK